MLETLALVKFNRAENIKVTVEQLVKLVQRKYITDVKIKVKYIILTAVMWSDTLTLS